MYLDGGIPTPLKNMSWSVGMIIPNIWKIKKNPNHQPGISIYIYIYCIWGWVKTYYCHIWGNKQSINHLYVCVYIYISIPKHNCYI